MLQISQNCLLPTTTPCVAFFLQSPAATLRSHRAASDIFLRRFLSPSGNFLIISIAGFLLHSLDLIKLLRRPSGLPTNLLWFTHGARTPLASIDFHQASVMVEHQGIEPCCWLNPFTAGSRTHVGLMLHILVHLFGIEPNRGSNLLQMVYKTILPPRHRCIFSTRGKLLTPFPFTTPGVSVIWGPSILVPLRGVEPPNFWF